jgi:hypothetical protein
MISLIMLISTALLLDSNIRNSMYSGKIAVPPGGGGIVAYFSDYLFFRKW